MLALRAWKSVQFEQELISMNRCCTGDQNSRSNFLAHRMGNRFWCCVLLFLFQIVKERGGFDRGERMGWRTAARLSSLVGHDRTMIDAYNNQISRLPLRAFEATPWSVVGVRRASPSATFARVARVARVQHAQRRAVHRRRQALLRVRVGRRRQPQQRRQQSQCPPFSLLTMPC